jgi:hypothetical protein
MRSGSILQLRKARGWASPTSTRAAADPQLRPIKFLTRQMCGVTMTKWAAAAVRRRRLSWGSPPVGGGQIQDRRRASVKGRTPIFGASICDFIPTLGDRTALNDERARERDARHRSLLIEPPMIEDVSLALAPPATLIAPPIEAEAS